jgi:hypothetical protein
LASAGFELQSAVRLSSNSKNLADMQLTVDAMSTLVDRHNFQTYVLITGDRDFAPLVQALRKRGKQVIGVGLRHTTSQNLARLCDHYVYYDELDAAARELLVDQVEELLQRALDQLLQDETRVPASLLKQRMQALSKGAFSRSAQGKRNFRKLLTDYPEIVEFQQEGTTLYVCRPGETLPDTPKADQAPRSLEDDQVEALLKEALDELLQDKDRVRASLLKQRMQDLSNGTFSEAEQGYKSFLKFLEQYKDLVEVNQERSTLYISRIAESETTKPSPDSQPMLAAEARELLRTALDKLLIDQDRVRASLLKQEMQELSGGAFDEAQQGVDTFSQFLEKYPNQVQLQRRGTTLLVSRPTNYIDPTQLHVNYRTALKKQGLRVVPSTIRLMVLKDLIAFLEAHQKVQWRHLVDHLVDHYQNARKEGVSKSFINDVLRVARRSDVIGVQNGGELAMSPIYLKIAGDRVFQDAVIRCDTTYLVQIKGLDLAFSLEEASIALYESVSHARYLKVILNRFYETEQASV